MRPPGASVRAAALERLAEPLELAVDADAQRLEGARRRVQPGAAAAAGRAAHDLGELAWWCGSACARARARSRARCAATRLLAVLVDHVGELPLAHAVHEVGGRGRARAVHPHVERALGLEAEAALGIVELHGGDPEVEQDAVRRLARESLRDLAEVGLLEARAASELTKA